MKTETSTEKIRSACREHGRQRMIRAIDQIESRARESNQPLVRLGPGADYERRIDPDAATCSIDWINVTIGIGLFLLGIAAWAY